MNHRLVTGAAIASVLLSLSALAQQPSTTAPHTISGLSGTYLIAYRTQAHVDRSKPEVFDGVITAINEFLNTKNVVVIPDPRARHYSHPGLDVAAEYGESCQRRHGR